MNKDVRIVEVGARDGLQNEKTVVDTQTKFEFIKKLHEAGLDTIEISSFVRADKIPQMQDATELYKMVKENLDLSKLKTPCLVPNIKGLENALNVGVDEIAIFTATSNEFNKRNINASVDESLERLKIVTDAVNTQYNEKNIKIRGYLSTVFGCPYEGKISIDDTLKVIEKLVNLGVYEISLGDTIGVANPYQVKELISSINKNFDLSMMAMHFHDTEGMALANIFTSYEEGIRVFDSSAAGLGGCPYAKGATGNVATDDVVNLFDKLNVRTGIDKEKLHEASKFIIDYLGKKSPSKFFNAYEGRRG